MKMDCWGDVGIKSDNCKFSPDVMEGLIHVFQKAEIIYQAHFDNQDILDH